MRARSSGASSEELPGTTLETIVAGLQLSPVLWEVEISPPPSLDEHPGPVTERLGLTIQQLGVLPGSTVHFRRPAGR
jgi:hypothetical protein